MTFQSPSKLETVGSVASEFDYKFKEYYNTATNAASNAVKNIGVKEVLTASVLSVSGLAGAYVVGNLFNAGE